jgi:truncated hemoglobin YjbI
MTDKDWILKVVNEFYAKAKNDILIGYHFRIISDFESHIPRIAAFWELQLLGSTQRTLNSPFDLMKVHTPLHLKRGELGRWVLLFKKTLDEQEAPEFMELKTKWLEKLDFFAGIFSRFFGL